MSNFEQTDSSLLDTVSRMEKMRDFICKYFHTLSWPRQDEIGCYQVCLVDARRLAWIDPMPLLSPFGKNLPSKNHPQICSESEENQGETFRDVFGDAA
jgi:hypothetical protein